MFMKIIFLIALSLIAIPTIAQKNLLDNFLKNPSFEVKILGDSIVEIYDKVKNYRWLKTIAEYPKYDNTTEANLIITLDTVNFAAYDSYYRLWGSLPAVNSYGKYIAVDANKNGKIEIYGYAIQYDQNWFFYQQRIYEQINDSKFTQISVLQDSFSSFHDLGDITGDGLLDLISVGLRFYKQDTTTDLLNIFNFEYNPFPPVYQFNDVTFYDIDSDGNQEIIYYLFAGDGDSVWAYSNHVAKYDSQINNYELIYYNRPQPEYLTSGISTGDFDQDGKGNFATGSIGGKLYIYEFVQGTQYQVEFTKELETYNAFLTIMTHDMNGNGKPEIWIGGDFSSSIYGGITRLFAFEASAPGIYEQVYQIDIRGLFSAIYGKLRYTDLDGDGMKDLFLTNANLAFGFKYDGIGNYYMDFVKSMPVLDSIYVYQSLDRVDIADLDGDGIVEIIPQYELNKGWQDSWENRSVFLKRDKLSDIDDENIIYPSDNNLLQNYPNPFNPSTKISYSIKEEGLVTIKVYDILGKEIAILVNEIQPAGIYEAEFNASQLPSGMYIYKIQAGSFSDVKKMLLTK